MQSPEWSSCAGWEAEEEPAELGWPAGKSGGGAAGLARPVEGRGGTGRQRGRCSGERRRGRRPTPESRYGRYGARNAKIKIWGWTGERDGSTGGFG